MTNCQRCQWTPSKEALFRVTSEILDLAVCGHCALEAVDLLGSKPSDLRIGKLKVEETKAVAMPAAN